MEAVHYMLGGGGALLLFLIGVVWQVVSARMDRVQTDHDVLAAEFNKHQLKVAEEYVSRPWLESALKPIMDELQKIDRKLDGKADKP